MPAARSDKGKQAISAKIYLSAGVTSVCRKVLPSPTIVGGARRTCLKTPAPKEISGQRLSKGYVDFFVIHACRWPPVPSMPGNRAWRDGQRGGAPARADDAAIIHVAPECATSARRREPDCL